MANFSTHTSLASTIRGAVTALGLAAVMLAVTGSTARAQSGDPLVGTWLVQVTLRNCQSGAALGAPFFSLVTFHGDGTISEVPGGTSFAPGQRSPGHGSWSKLGANTYRQSMVALILFDTPAGYPVPPGFQAGGQTVNHTVTLVDAGHLTSTGTNAFYTNALALYRTGCSTADAQRIP